MRRPIFSTSSPSLGHTSLTFWLFFIQLTPFDYWIRTPVAAAFNFGGMTGQNAQRQANHPRSSAAENCGGTRWSGRIMHTGERICRRPAQGRINRTERFDSFYSDVAPITDLASTSLKSLRRDCFKLFSAWEQLMICPLEIKPARPCFGCAGRLLGPCAGWGSRGW